MGQTKISCRPAHSLVGESGTQKTYYFIYLKPMIQISQGSEGI